MTDHVATLGEAPGELYLERVTAEVLEMDAHGFAHGYRLWLTWS